MRPLPLTLACIPVGRHAVVGSDMVPVLAKGHNDMEGRGEGGWGGDAMWPILPVTTVLHLARPYKGKEKRCFWSLTMFPSLLLYPGTLFCISPRYHYSKQHTSLSFPYGYVLPAYNPLPKACP